MFSKCVAGQSSKAQTSIKSGTRFLERTEDNCICKTFSFFFKSLIWF